jgi:release factor glutamine methyltransferase
MSGATLSALIDDATQQLSEVSQSPRLDAEVLLAEAVSKPRSFLFAWPDWSPGEQPAKVFQEAVARRVSGEPVAYITGWREFWSLWLRVTPDVLIPRPETERLVELVVERTEPSAALRIADIGTGSGAIALALASERRQCTITAVDCCAEALQVAADNALRLDINNVQFRHGNLCGPLEDAQYDIIVSNPPYVVATDPALSDSEIRFEPRGALDGGDDGLHIFRELAPQARERLVSGGNVWFEHGAEQGPAVREILRAARFEDVTTFVDYLGHDRICFGQAR